MTYKKVLYKLGKIIWGLIGIVVLSWTCFWYYKIHIIGNLGGILGGTILMAIGLTALMFFMLITILFIVIKFIINKQKKK